MVACSSAGGSITIPSQPLAGPYTRCTLSGTGSAAAVTGSVDYCCEGGGNSLTVTAFQVFP